MQGVLSTTQQGEAKRDAKTTLARIKKGEGLRSIGKSLGLSHIGVRKWLLREVGPEYHEMQTDGLLTRVVEADKMLMDARDPVSIARAREIARFARMDLERRRPALYGAKTQVSGDLSITVQIARGVTYEGEKPNEISEAITAGSCVTSQESGVSD
jgi:hypothetical protein